MSMQVPARHAHTFAWLSKKVPTWVFAVFVAAIAVAYCPNVVRVFNILDDYDVLLFKSEHFYLPHLETEHLLSIARPIAAL